VDVDSGEAWEVSEDSSVGSSHGEFVLWKFWKDAKVSHLLAHHHLTVDRVLGSQHIY